MPIPIRHRTRSYLRVGYIPLVDAAPLIVARDSGLFSRAGLDVSLYQEPGWATVMDKLAAGELDAAHCLAGMVFAPSGHRRDPQDGLVTGLCLNTHGNTIALSKALWDRGIRDGEGLAAAVKHRSVRLPLVFGAVHPLSSHIILLKTWLARHGLKPGEHYQVVFLPPNLMPSTMRQGHLDGFCAGEPWGSAAALEGEGFITATSDEIFPGHLEKVLAVRADFAQEKTDMVHALNRAVLEACRLCDDSGFRSNLASLLAAPGNLRVPHDWLANSLVGDMNLGFGRTRGSRDLHVFHGPEVNRPDPLRFGWMKQELVRLGHLADVPGHDIRSHILASDPLDKSTAPARRPRAASAGKSNVQHAH